MTNVTAPSGTAPTLYVCRDTAPSASNPYFWYPWFGNAWPSGYQWVAGNDWTGDGYNADGTLASGQILAVGMGNPLQPGVYYVGVLNSSGVSNVSYTLSSRGIGAGQTIPVGSLAFSNGSVSKAGLPGREAAYYSIIVPSNMPSWRMELNTNMGDALLIAQQDFLPSVAAGPYPPYALAGGRRMDKLGNEQYLMMPQTGETNIVAGTYYLAVVSEGIGPVLNSTLGINASSFTVCRRLGRWTIPGCRT
jgi:hypothetical protein